MAGIPLWSLPPTTYLLPPREKAPISRGVFNRNENSLHLLYGHGLHRGDRDHLLFLVHRALDRDLRSRHLHQHGVVAGEDEYGLVRRVVQGPLGALLLHALDRA